MTEPEKMQKAGQQLAAIAAGRSPQNTGQEDKPDGAGHDDADDQSGKLTALPNEATIETSNGTGASSSDRSDEAAQDNREEP